MPVSKLPSQRMTEAFVTLATNNEYAVGAMVLAASLRNTKTTKKLVCMVTNTVESPMLEQVKEFFDEVVRVDVLDSRDEVNLKLLNRPELGVTFTKLHCWRLTQYTKCVFMDADTMVTQNVDDMFEGEEITAAPDPGWPDCFNSGVFVFTPSLDTYRALLDFALEEGSFDGGDQGLLNAFFPHWRIQGAKYRLPYTDNCCTHCFYTYVPALKKFGWNVRVIHFIGQNKPWNYINNIQNGDLYIGEYMDPQSLRFLNLWWHYFLTEVQPKIKSFLIGKMAKLAQIKVKHGPVVDMVRDPSPPGKSMAKWERGEIDYKGSERFEKIREKLDKSIENKKHK
ncbi:unnamed protein product [Hymenolepis diminuta]|uniref:glycogenin glucosyltransferase n=1 Tax=Hymenolepis diminuta TaxID=6216 RepID=A0A0R3SHW3_HYMDI|nr:unnamed protein product [Hymenolepis diminuta]